jgi:ABC-type multidrug transport system ATPase subunit
VIEVRDLSKRHGDERAADRRTFTVEPGAIRALP